MTIYRHGQYVILFEVGSDDVSVHELVPGCLFPTEEHLTRSKYLEERSDDLSNELAHLGTSCPLAEMIEGFCGGCLREDLEQPGGGKRV